MPCSLKLASNSGKMVETCVGPSELHLKKELTALRKSRLLRDPETCSSWRSPLSSRSVAAATYSLKNESQIKNNTMSSNTSGSFESGFNSKQAVRNENRRKKVYLYNWGHHSSKSSDSGVKLDEDNCQESVHASLEDTCNHEKLDAKNGINLDNQQSVFTAKGTHSDLPVKRTIKKQRRKNNSKQGVARSSAILKLLDLPSSSLAILNSMEHYDDSEYSNSEDMQYSVHESTQKSACASQEASPLFSVSGCGNWSDSSKVKNIRREESSYSCTPVSASSFNRYGDQNPCTIGSWDGTVPFSDDEAEEIGLPGRQGCGIPCYSSKRRKDKGCGGWYSPSLSDTLRRKGSSILCGSQSMNHRRRSSGVYKRKVTPRSSQGLPLLINRCDGRSSADSESEELSTNFGELDLEALSRLDGRRWSNCRSQEALDLVQSGASDHRSLSQKYRPKSFEEIIGQSIVVQSLTNAISRGRIAPAYLFQGPRGTGKTCIARIAAAALNCQSTEKNKPCGFCRECSDFASGNGSNMIEADATDKKGLDRVKYLLNNLSTASNFSWHKVVVIDECHMLSSKTWSSFIKFLEEPLSCVVFIFITMDPDKLPRAVVSRCQKFIFSKIKDADVVRRLRKLSSEECLDVEAEALDLIALNSNGSLRDAETILDQLSLLGKRITTSLVNDVVGVVSDEKLVDLLELAMSSDTAETVRKSRELLYSGIDPMRLMSQLAGLIMDIIAGTHQLASSKTSKSVLGGRSLTEAELDRLHQALQILSDAEKQLRHSSERSTWFTAALLQLGSGHSIEPIHSSGSSSKHSTKNLTGGIYEAVKANSGHEKPDGLLKLGRSNLASTLKIASSHSSPLANTSSSMSMRDNLSFTDNKSNGMFRSLGLENLEDIWKRCIQGCHSKTLRNLLSNNGKLVSISEVEGVLIVLLAFGEASIKSRVERFISSITDSMETVFGRNVQVKIGLLSDDNVKESQARQVSLLQKQAGSNEEQTMESGNLSYSPPRDTKQQLTNLPKRDDSGSKVQSSTDADETFQVGSLPIFSSKENGVHDSREKGHEVPIQRVHGLATDEQRLESAWVQAADKGTPGFVSNSKLERNQIVLQNGFKHQNKDVAQEISSNSKHWEDELNREIKALKINDSHSHLKDDIGGRVDLFSISPSKLHSNMSSSIFGKEDLGYDSRAGWNGLLCWKTSKSRRVKAKQGSRVKSQKASRISCFGRRRSKKSVESRPHR